MNLSTIQKGKLLKSIVSGALFVIIWQIASFGYSDIIIPSPILVIKSTFEFFTDSTFYDHLYVTLYRGLLSYSLSLLLGITVAILFYMNNFIRSIFYPYIMVLQSIPRISWVVLAMIWLPLNSVIIVFIILITIFPVMVLNTLEGLENIDSELIDMATVFDIKKNSLIKNIYIPSTMPHIISGAKITMGIMWKTIVMAELLTVNNGLGAQIGYLKTALATDKILAITLVIVVLNLLFQRALDMIDKRIGRWKYKNV